MMRIIFLVMLPLAWSYGGSQGGGAFSYVDSSGNRVFKSNLDNQRLAFDAARKAFDISSNGAGFYPNPTIATRFGAFNNFPPPAFPFNGVPAMPNYGNSAFAGAAAGPGYQHQVASIYPANPGNPNVNKVINHYSDTSGPNTGGFYSVSSKSYSSSSNLNGKETNSRGAETLVNNNGKVTHYKVQN